MKRASPEALYVVAAAGVGLALSISVLGMATFSLFVVPISNEFHWGRGDISISYTIMCYAVAALSPLAGQIVDRHGVRPLLLPSITLFGVMLTALSRLNCNLLLYYGAYFLLALAGVGTAPPTYSRAVVLWFKERRGLALGSSLAGVGLGTAVMPILLQTLIDRFGWRYAFLGDALLVLAVSLPLVWLFVREPAMAQVSAGSVPALEGLSLRESLAQRKFWQMLVAFALLGAFTAGTISHLVPLLRDRGMPPGTAASALSMLGAALIVGRLSTGYLLDKLFAPWVVSGCIAMAAIGLAMLGAGLEGQSAQIAVVLIGFAVGAELDFMSFLIAAYFGLKAYGRIYGIHYGVFILGSGAGPVIMGYAQQHYQTYTPAISTLLLGVLISIPLILTLGAYPQQARLDRHR